MFTPVTENILLATPEKATETVPYFLVLVFLEIQCHSTEHKGKFITVTERVIFNIQEMLLVCHMDMCIVCSALENLAHY